MTAIVATAIALAAIAIVLLVGPSRMIANWRRLSETSQRTILAAPLVLAALVYGTQNI